MWRSPIPVKADDSEERIVPSSGGQESASEEQC
jgi:hypothetical protein